MISFDILRLVPKFILNDKNGYAIAMAIKAGMQYFLDTAQTGLDTVLYVDEMPEWRLDEMAWELDCLYDHSAPAEIKREWIKNALPLYSIWGTKESVIRYISGYFGSASVEENWQYSGLPFHFRVMVEGEWTPENEAWARKALAAAKNVRSVLDSMRIGSKCDIAIKADGKVLARFPYPMTGEQNWAGRWPQENIKGVLGETDNPAVQADDTYAMILYKLCGQDEI